MPHRTAAPLDIRYRLTQNSYVLLVVAVVLAQACGSSETAPDASDVAPVATPKTYTLSGAERTEGWQVLFDGEDVSQWRGYGRAEFPTRGWSVVDGELHVERSGTEEAGFGGDVITRDTYADFDFVVEYALSDTANSGLFYLVQEVDDTPIWHSAPEFQLLDDATYRELMDLNPAQFTGSNYDMHAAPRDFSRPVGEWNVARVVKRGDLVEHYLNDSLTVRYRLGDEDWRRRYGASKFAHYPTYASVDRGHLGLQDHGHLVRFRRIRVREL